MTRSISVLALLVALAAAVLLPAVASAQPDPAGEWAGEIAIPGSPLRIEVSLVHDEAWSGTIAIPQQNLSDFELADVVVEPPAVAFRMPGIPGDPAFDGTLSDDGARINGTFTQGGQSFGFHLERAGDVREERAERDRHALEGFGAFVRAAMDSLAVPGAAVAIVRGDEVLLMEGFGYRDLERQQPVTPQTLFAIGSATKAMTAAALATLVEEGALDWSTPVIDYLPSFRLEDEVASRQMNAVDLLTHRSGLPRHDLLWYMGDFSRQELFERLRHLAPTEPFRVRWQYQNLMYLAAGVLTEELTGQTWEEAVRQRLFVPLGMTAANFSVEESQRRPDFARPHGGGRDSISVMDFRPIDPIGPAGSVNASVQDMARWVSFQLGDGTVGGTEVLAASTLGFLHAPQVVVAGQRATAERPYLMYGLGWFVEPFRGRRMIHHGGNIDGFSAMVGFMPDDEVGIVVLTNKNASPLPGAVMLDAFDRLLGEDEQDWLAQILTQMPELDRETPGAERIEGTSPAHPLSDYAGTYEHPGYGPITISLSEDRLRADYFRLSATLEHVHFETFELDLDALDVGLRVAFITDANGRVSRLEVPLEMSGEPLVFVRQPDAELRDPDYLAEFVGAYQGPVRLTVARRGPDTLTLTVQGQGTWTLTPTRRDAFDIDGLAGFSVRFEREEGRIVRLIGIQPNISFPAERVDEQG